jgi:YD repeat-containing protein
MKKTIAVLLFLWLLNMKMTLAQDSSKIIPLPPNAAELFKYNSIPVAPMTGVPDISYPLYEVNTGKIKLPITLSYHASGIKVSQRATWVGLGWSLMPGANISREIRGGPDEETNHGWFNHYSSVDTLGLIENYSTMDNWFQNHPDRQPDFYTYNIPGKSGKFLYSRETSKFVNFPYQPVVIKRVASRNDYEITDDDGTKYVFGMTQSVTPDEAPIKTNVQSWYLTQIISDDTKDTVFLKYNDTSVSGFDETVISTATSTFTYYANNEIADGKFFPGDKVNTVSSDNIYSPLTLSEILFRQGKVAFYSKGVRTDKGTLLDSVVVYAKDGNTYSRVKKISFNYGYFFSGSALPAPADYRLKLQAFTKVNLPGGQPETYKFEYDNIQPPSIYSYAVDYFGFYNGATNNGDLMPNILPDQDQLKDTGPLGYANRNPSATHMMAGMLRKIVHPTGGYTVFDYEPNKYETSRLPSKTVDIAGFQVTGKGTIPLVWDSASFKVTSPINASSHPADITITFSPFSANVRETAQKVILKDVTAGRDIQVWTTDIYADFQNPHTVQYRHQCDVTHTYRLVGMVNDVTTTKLTVLATSVLPDSSALIKIGGGIRVNSISSYNADDSLQQQEKYAYGISENGIGYMPLTGDETIYGNFSQKTFLVFKPDPIGCSYVHKSEITYTANNAYPTMSFLGAPVIYSSVARYEMAKGKPNGKTLLQYETRRDYISLPVKGRTGGKELIDNTPADVNLQSEHIYRSNADGSYSLQKQTINRYAAGVTKESVKAAAMWKEYTVLGGWCPEAELDEFGYMVFSIKTGGLRMSSTEETIFDDNGNALINTTVFDYNNFALPKSVKRTNSKGDTLSTLMHYPGEHAASTSDAAVLNRMVRRNMLRTPYWVGSYAKNALLKYNRTLFADQWPGNDSLIAPKVDSEWISGTGATTAAMVRYEGYDKYGSVTQMTGRNGITSSYAWSADGTFPVSQTIGAPTTSVLYDGFEDAGSWTGVTRDNGQARTGLYAGLITNAGTYVNQRWTSVSLAAPTTFKYSGWVYSAGPAANIALLMKKSGETGAYSYIDNIPVSQSGRWAYVEKEYLVPADVKSMSIRIDNNGTGKVWFDDIKLRPSSSQMNSFTYLPLIGMTSKSDDQNHILKYEYDGLGRLRVIRDQDGNILKQIDYQYQASLTK